jgi:hypothetical protein
MNAAAATTLALTGGYLLMEEDFKSKRKGQRIKLYLIRCFFPCPRITRVTRSPRVMDTQVDTYFLADCQSVRMRATL